MRDAGKEYSRTHREACLRQYLLCFDMPSALHRRETDKHCTWWVTRQRQDVLRLIKCLDVIHLRTDGHQHEICCFGGRYCGIGAFPGRIDNRELCALPFGGFQYLIKTRYLTRYDSREIPVTPVAPFGSGRLRIQIDNCGFYTVQGSRDGKAKGGGGCGTPALFSENRQLFHIGFLIALDIYNSVAL